MAQETLVPNGDDGGWPTGGFADIDEGVPGDEVAVMSTTVDDDFALLDLTASAVADADTVDDITIKISARTLGVGGKDSLVVDLFIGGTGQGTVTTAVLTGSFATYTLTNAGLWDSDWTAAQMDGAQVQVKANQTGKAEGATWEIDSIDVVVDYTPAASGRIMSSLASSGGLAGPGGIAGQGGGLAG